MNFRKPNRFQFEPQTGNLNRRLLSLGILSFILIGALIIRLWDLQVIRGKDFRRRSENNRIEKKPIPGLRGKIFDRNARLLAGNRAAFHLALIARSVPDLANTLKHLHAHTGLDAKWAQSRIQQGNRFKPIIVQKDLSREAVGQVMEHRWQLPPGVLLRINSQREYPQRDTAAHLMGYLGEVSDVQLKKKRGYRRGDMTGKHGIEREFEEVLRGAYGRSWVERDVFGREIKVLGVKPARPGRNLILTLDLNLQKKAESLLAGQSGVLIAMDPRNGEILALASNPRFDPNTLTQGMSPSSWSALLQNPLRVLQDRATRGFYPPGSVFKIIMAVAALEEGVLEASETLYCPGQYRFGNRTYRCWESRGHRNANLHRALVESCDVFFYQLGLKLGIDRIARYASGFGLGRPTGIVSQGEKGGIVASPTWKKKVLGQPWYPGETVSVSIGQGYTLVTPMQMAVLIAAIANRGTLFRPNLIRRIEENDGTVRETFGPEIKGHLPVHPKNLEIVRAALRGVVQDVRGTGFRAKVPGIQVAGKTGTAQVVRLKHRKDSKEQRAGPRLFRDHAWFVAFAPYKEPTIAVVVLAEHAGVGGSRYAPLARDLIAYHLGIRMEKQPSGAGFSATPSFGRRVSTSVRLRGAEVRRASDL